MYGGYRRRGYSSYYKPRIVNQRKTRKATATGATQLTKRSFVKVWINWTDAPGSVAPFTQVGVLGTYQLQGYLRVNNLYDPSAMTGNPYSVGFSTYRRLYDYYRPYKFKAQFKLNFVTTGTGRYTDYYYICAYPTLGSTAPWDDLFSISRDMRYALQTARGNRFLVVKRVTASTMKVKNVITLNCPAVSLVDLIGVNPAIVVGSTGVPSDVYSSVTTGSPTAGVYWHYLVVTATAYVPNFSCEVQDSYSAKTLFYTRAEITQAVTADEQV